MIASIIGYPVGFVVMGLLLWVFDPLNKFGRRR